MSDETVVGKIPFNAVASGEHSVAIGHEAVATGKYSTAAWTSNPRCDALQDREKMFTSQAAWLSAWKQEARQLERELAEAKEALGNWKDVAEGMSAWKDELLQVEKQRDQWREVALQIHKQMGCKCGVNCDACAAADDAFVALRAKEASRE